MKTWGTICLLLAATGASAAPPEIRFEESSVSAKGVSPSGEVAFFSVAREATGVGSQIVRREEVVADADGDGVVRLELGKPVPPRSMWAAVDLATGELALAAPGDYPLRRVAFAAETVQAGAGGRLERLLAGNRDWVELFVARPAVGAWALTVWDGAEDDEDGPANRQVSAAVSRMAPVGKSPASPEALAPGDVVVVMDPNAMQVSAQRLAGGGR